MNTNNYLPFDLETALKHPERVVTRDGRKVEQIHHFKRDTETKHPIYGIIDGNVKHWNSGGIFCRGCNSGHDLFLLPEVKECWVNVYEEAFKSEGNMVHFFESKQKAIDGRSVTKTYIKTIRITNEPE